MPKDRYRWQDWRVSRRRSIRRTRVCDGCGETFEPIVERQGLCIKCSARAAEDERDTLALAEYRRIKEEERRRKREQEAALAKEAEAIKISQPGSKKRVRADKVQRTHKGKRRGHRSKDKSVQIAHVVHRKRKENWSDRKIAKVLGIPLAEVKAVPAPTRLSRQGPAPTPHQSGEGKG